jgi:RND family efflux transporter MFP subunit
MTGKKRLFFALSMLLSIGICPAGCAKKKEPAPPPPRVTVARPVRLVVTDHLEMTGNTQAVKSVQLVARVPGYLEAIYFKDGQIVRKGQQLFRIQQDTYVAGLHQTEGQVKALSAQLEYAQGQLIRYMNLLKQKAASKNDVDNWRYQRDSAMANLETAIANRDLAKLNLGYTDIRAPFEGRIDRRLQDPGNLVGAGTNTPLAQLVQTDPIYVYFTISDTDMARLSRSMNGLPGLRGNTTWPVRVGLLKEEGYPHEGALDFSATGLSAGTGTLLMRGVLPNPTGAILPGLYARVRVPMQSRSAILLPDTALSSDQQGSYVLLLGKENIALRKSVKPGHLSDNLRVIEEGLEGNEWVIVKGLLKAAPGRKVTPITEAAATADEQAPPGQKGGTP